ncbi:IS66 family insertion sequence element accessory protein TnpB (plasmid) [Rhizobium sp. K1/93]|nr:IS66 family insertion sequence element accessory protein TnpB [Rhizobium sp. L58/93]MBO9172059.1 IS66 family insertion sequence element accessory protein TnpB [Rhizobium sp. L245/93]QXZ88281.1 IS66 family insertion sequence element accessory protein TnpB [Rhizobium sp. K1/93]QXZ94252.1 IS66 family insertion sequence element accessory protein TnpB [Rhizobium sp. K15/93]QYA05658.1 IS66 family insertion sequence element accessory protein TnpB [Rhizobium sp. B21/90]
MFKLNADLKVYLHREPIDFRAGINSLAVLVQESMELDPFPPAVFAFCNRRYESPCQAASPLLRHWPSPWSTNTSGRRRSSHPWRTSASC